MPHSRHTGIRREDVAATPALEILAESPEAGVCVVKTLGQRQFYITGHMEYDSDTLAKEYWRDVDKGLPIDMPCNYFPNNDPSRPPLVSWRAHANLFYSNWLNFYVYQETPFELESIGTGATSASAGQGGVK